MYKLSACTGLSTGDSLAQTTQGWLQTWAAVAPVFPPAPVRHFKPHMGARQYRAWICCSRLCCILIPSWSSWSHCCASPTVLCSVYLLSKISASSMAAPRSSIFFSWLLIARISWCLRCEKGAKRREIMEHQNKPLKLEQRLAGKEDYTMSIYWDL